MHINSMDCYMVYAKNNTGHHPLLTWYFVYIKSMQLTYFIVQLFKSESDIVLHKVNSNI